MGSPMRKTRGLTSAQLTMSDEPFREELVALGRLRMDAWRDHLTSHAF